MVAMRCGATDVRGSAPVPSAAMRTRRFVVAIAVVALVAVVAVVVAVFGFSDRSSADSRLSLLATVSGEAATMTPVPGSTDRYTLTVTDADPAVVWFTDRPARQSGVATLERFAAEWRPGEPFATDPPNAAIVLHATAGTTDTIVVELQTLSADAAARTLTAEVRVLSQTEANQLTGNLAYHGQHHDPTGIPARLGAITLFVDPGPVTTDSGNGGRGGLLFTISGTGGAGGLGGSYGGGIQSGVGAPVN